MTLNIYDVAVAGAPLYTETQNVSVTNGLFNLVIGEVTPLTLPFDTQYFLGITIAPSGELTPRQALVSAPYALNAKNAESITGGVAGQVMAANGGVAGFTANPHISGSVGIGTATPTHKLEVNHGGGQGVVVRSSSSFSVFDIDAENGDAALRFVNNGANQWTIRSDPGANHLQFFELNGGGERMRIENLTGRVVANGDFTVLGAKLFTMDHPLDPLNKLLMHAAVESNEVLNTYSGNVTTDGSGKAIVSLPDYFEALNKDYRYQLTVIGGGFAQAIVSQEVKNNRFEIATNQPNVKVSWEVKGVRNDARMKKTPFVAEAVKSDAMKGRYFDLIAYETAGSKLATAKSGLPSSIDDAVPAPKLAIKPDILRGGVLEQQTATPARAPNAVNQGASVR
jgi:hypothetical protein